jgi:hypothetical protein
MINENALNILPYIALFVRLIPDSVRFTPTSVCMFQLVGLKT